jgi:hypothetical protein
LLFFADKFLILGWDSFRVYILDIIAILPAAMSSASRVIVRALILPIGASRLGPMPSATRSMRILILAVAAPAPASTTRGTGTISVIAVVIPIIVVSAITILASVIMVVLMMVVVVTVFSPRVVGR